MRPTSAPPHVPSSNPHKPRQRTRVLKPDEHVRRGPPVRPTRQPLLAVVCPLDTDLDLDGLELVLYAASVTARLVAQRPGLVEDSLRATTVLGRLRFALVVAAGHGRRLSE